MPETNDPYSRPINATRPDAQLVGEFYGRPATDKARNHAAGRVAAAGVRALPSVVPVDMDARPPVKLEKKVKKPRKPAEPPAPTADDAYVEYTHVETPIEAEPPITEEDLFG